MIPELDIQGTNQEAHAALKEIPETWYPCYITRQFMLYIALTVILKIEKFEISLNTE
jgi:hypothetical protein